MPTLLGRRRFNQSGVKFAGQSPIQKFRKFDGNRFEAVRAFPLKGDALRDIKERSAENPGVFEHRIVNLAGMWVVYARGQRKGQRKIG